MPLSLALLLPLALALPARAAEVCTATSAEVVTTEEQAENAYTALDEAGFRAASERLLGLLGCLTEPMPREQLAPVHRAVGLYYAASGDLDRARQAFAAARSIEPGWKFPESLLPAGHPVRTLYGSLPLEGGTFEPLPVDAVRVRLDGRVATARPTAWPTLIQIYAEDGAVLQSAYLWPGDPLPELPRASVQPAAAPLPAAPPGRAGPSWGLLGAAGVAGAGAVVLSSVWIQTAQAAGSDATNPVARDTLAGRANALGVGTLALGGLAVGAGVGAFFVVSW